MSAADSAREAARNGDGKFGTQPPRTAADVDLEPEATPDTWQLDIVYNWGENETFTIDREGNLPAPVRSDRLTLIQLLSFKSTIFGDNDEVTLAEAIADPESATGLRPVFDTYDGPTSLMGVVTRFWAV